jgi:hypothetical protein
MSSRQADTLTKAEFFTTTHRLTGEVQTGPNPLSDLLNDKSQSYLLVFNVYLSRLSDPGEIGAYAPVAYLSKENISFVIVPQREARSPEQSRYNLQRYGALATLPGFEITGMFAGPPRFDLRTFSPATLETFVVLNEASAQAVSWPETTFSGEVILVNRMSLESFCLSE